MNAKKYTEKNQHLLQKIYESAVNSGATCIETSTSTGYYSKGWVIIASNAEGGLFYELLSTSGNDFYKYPHPYTLINEFAERGFLRMTDELRIQRDKKRVEIITQKINGASEERNDSMIIHWRKKRKMLIDRLVRDLDRLKPWLSK